MIKRRVLFIATLIGLCLLYNCQATMQAADGPVPVAEEMRIVGPGEVLAGDLVVLNAKVPENAGLDWAISPPEAAARFYVDSNKRTSVFASRAKGVYIFALAVAVDGEAKCLVHILHNGVGPGPEPDPEPEPDPIPPVPGKRFVLVVSETGERSGALAATLMGLRGYLQDKDHEFRFVDPDFEDRGGKTPVWYEAYSEYIEKAEIKGPALVIGVLSKDGKTVDQIFARALPKTAAAAIEAVKAKGG